MLPNKKLLPEGLGPFTEEQLEQLRKSYGTLTKIDPASPHYQKLIKLLNSLTQEQLKQLLLANIPFISILAKNRIVK